MSGNEQAPEPTGTPQGSTGPISDFLHRHRRTIIAAALFILVLIVYVMNRADAKPPVLEFLVALTAALTMHLLDRLWLSVEAQETYDKLRQQIVANVATETQKSIKTIAAMNRSGVRRVYANREEAELDIKQSLTSQRTENIRLIGISLNDFVRGRENQVLGQAWNVLKRSIKNGIGPNRSLDVKVLIIDPTCLGAQLRSKGEERNDPNAIGRLRDEVNSSITELIALENASKQTGVTIQCKLYRLPPILFLCWTDSDCYVQQYYFWSTRDDDEKSFPVIKFQNTDSESIHAELTKHFNWIWQNASIGLAEYKTEYSRGVDKGVVQSGIANVFTVPSEGLARMIHLLHKAQSRVSIQGNSLHSFFNTRPDPPPLYEAIKNLLIADAVTIELLFLNPDSEQARFRAYREYSLKNTELNREQYFSSQSAHSGTILYKDTTDAQKALEALVKEVAITKPADWKPKLIAAIYDSAPYCFLMRADSSVLIEQYHYGKLPYDSEKLGKEVPLVEYTVTPSDIYDLTNRTPFDLFGSHFDFALRQATPLPVEQWVAEANNHGAP